jgi:hypothetical protein
MTEDLPRTPEGDLIRRARDRAIPKLSIRTAAARIGISPEHWGNIERGYKSFGANEEPRRLDTSPALIAKMARAVGVSPELLETEGGRPDAAAELREITRQHPAADAAGAADALAVAKIPAWPAHPRRPDIDFSGGDPEGLRPWRQGVLRQLYSVLGIASRLGAELPDPSEIPGAEGALLSLPPSRLPFTLGHELSAWHDDALTVGERVSVIARSRWLIAQMDEAERDRSGTGLGQHPAASATPALVSVARGAFRASS